MTHTSDPAAAAARRLEEATETARAVIAEAHGAVKDLRQAIRDARELRASWSAGLQAALGDATAAQAAELCKFGEDVIDTVEAQVQRATVYLENLLGVPDGKHLINLIKDTAAAELVESLERGTLTLLDANGRPLRVRRESS